MEHTGPCGQGLALPKQLPPTPSEPSIRYLLHPTFKGLETATPFAKEMGRSNPHLPTPPQQRRQAKLVATLFARR